MDWLDIPYILRLLAGIVVAVFVVKAGARLVKFLVGISVKENPPGNSGAIYQNYMQFSLLRKVFMAWFYVGLILEIIFIPFVLNRVRNASAGHLILFGAIAVIGITVNVIGLIKQRKLKRRFTKKHSS